MCRRDDPYTGMQRMQQMFGFRFISDLITDQEFRRHHADRNRKAVRFRITVEDIRLRAERELRNAVLYRGNLTALIEDANLMHVPEQTG